MSLMKDLFQKIQQIAQQENATHVTKVEIELGALAHISASHFKEHFDELRTGSIAEQAELIITENKDIHDTKAQDITLLSIDVA